VDVEVRERRGKEKNNVPSRKGREGEKETEREVKRRRGGERKKKGRG
jgi:hypothetical protein